jgi:long-subunit acyl-CoA synthetase (AMP-forming)
LSHIAGFFIKGTTVAIYDTLGEDSIRFIIDETELTTIAMSADLLPKML